MSGLSSRVNSLAVDSGLWVFPWLQNTEGCFRNRGLGEDFLFFLFLLPGWPLAFPNCLMIGYGGRFPKPGLEEDFLFFLFPLPGRLWAFPNSLITEYGGRFLKPGSEEDFLFFLFPLPGRLWAFPNSLITEYGGWFPKPGSGGKVFPGSVWPAAAAEKVSANADGGSKRAAFFSHKKGCLGKPSPKIHHLHPGSLRGKKRCS